MSVQVDDYGYRYGIKEQSSQDGFTDLPVAEQIKVLRAEMWEWATGRSKYSPNIYDTSAGTLPKTHAYAQHMITTKAIMIETLLKIDEANVEVGRCTARSPSTGTYCTEPFQHENPIHRGIYKGDVTRWKS